MQADPIRAPARAQDLILRHRVAGYRAGDLERRYARLPIEEDALVNYGFLPRRHLALMHPRTAARNWDAATRRKAAEVLDFVREHGPTHPRLVEEHFAHGRRTNAWGGTGNATTHLLDGMHYRGMLRIKRRDNGTRIYEAVEHARSTTAPKRGRRARDALLDLVVRKYAPLPAASLGYLVRLLGYGAPQLGSELRRALAAARATLASTRIEATTWYWPADENPRSKRYVPDDRVRLLAPFDPIVWDRRRFELLWGWTYRFEAYTPRAQAQARLLRPAAALARPRRRLGQCLVAAGRLQLKLGYADGAPREPEFRAALADEKARLREFLGL